MQRREYAAILKLDPSAFDCFHMRGCRPDDPWTIEMLRKAGRVVLRDDKSDLYSIVPEAWQDHMIHPWGRYESHIPALKQRIERERAA
jgi:hypothetical protein